MYFATGSTARFLLIGATALLTACGGGGGGDGSSTTPPPTTASTITTSNVQDVSAHAAVATNNLIMQIGGGADAVTGVSITTAAPGLLGVTMNQLYRALNSSSSSTLPVGITATETVACATSGNITVTANYASTLKVSAGDTFAITANNCLEDGELNNGKMNITINSITGTPGETSAWTGVLSFTFTDFSTTFNNESVAANGDMTINVNQPSPSSASYVVTGNSMKISATKSGATHTQTVNNYSFTGSETNDIFSYNANFTLTGNLAKVGNATYTVKTLNDFKQQGNNTPHQGAMKITGSDNSAATVTAVGGGNVTIGLDKNGDGTNEETINTTWAALIARL